MTPRLCGIVNITPDSFSDGGLFLAPEKAVAHARHLRAAGAEIVELGPASSSPDAPVLAAEEEIARLAPVLAALAGMEGLAVDSYRREVQLYALEHKIAMLNDVHGFSDARIYPELAAASCELVVMHALQPSGPADRRPSPDAVVEVVLRFFDERLAALTKAGIGEKRLILDPGMGLFLGRDPKASFTMLRKIEALRRHYRLPVMISVSRKSFLRRKDQTPGEAAPASLAAELFAAAAGADIIRTHDPAAFLDGWRIWRQLTGAGG